MNSTFKKIAQCLAIALVMTIAAPAAASAAKADAKSSSKTAKTSTAKNYAATFNYASGQSKSLSASETTKANNLVKWLKANPSAKVEIKGWASTSGKPEMNKQISLQRAETVKNYLVKKGINAKQIKVAGMGSTTTKNACRADVVAVAKK